MKKNGFVFIETIVVLVVLMAGILALYTVYNTISSNMDRRTYYDSVSDLYKTDILRSKLKTNISITGKFVEITSSNYSN